MSDIRIKQHPTLGILVCTDGHIMVPANKTQKPHWTYGSLTKKGYFRITINNKKHYSHRIIAETFISNPLNLPEIDHIDRNPTNNNVNNLRWADRLIQTRNTEPHSRVSKRGWVHTYEDKKQYDRLRGKQYIKEYASLHRRVTLKNHKTKWLPNNIAMELMKLPVRDREV